MEADYGHAGSTLSSGQNAVDADRPYLAKVSDLADEARHIGDYIEMFLDRCRGGGRLGEGKQGGTAPVPTGHLGNLDRLSENLSRVDKLARELQTIG